MNKHLKTKLLQILNPTEDGFTLVELLVVIIIVGVLASVALPNFVRQAGKARETEIKNAVGTVNRSQQSYHWEKNVFAQGADDDATLALLSIGFTSEYIDTFNITGDASEATIAPDNNDFNQDQTRGYSGGTFFGGGEYSTVICQSSEVAVNTPAPTDASDCGAGIIIK